MNYYDIRTDRVLTEKQLCGCGFTPNDTGTLNVAGIYPIIERKPELNPLLETIQLGKLRFAGDHYEQTFKVVPLPLPVAQAGLKPLVTAHRWQVETGGVTLPDGTKIATGIDDQNRISSALQGMADAAIAEVDFKSESGWVKLSREQLTGIAALIAAHVQACFSRERILHEAIDAAESVTALEEIDINTGWPGGMSNE